MNYHQKIAQLKERLKKINEIDPQLEFTRKEMQERRKKVEEDIRRYDSKKAELQRRNLQQLKKTSQPIILKKQQKEPQKTLVEPMPPKLQVNKIEVKQQGLQKVGNSGQKMKKTITTFPRSNGIFSQSTQIRRPANLDRAFTQPQLPTIPQKGLDDTKANQNIQKPQKINHSFSHIFSNKQQNKKMLIQNHQIQRPQNNVQKEESKLLKPKSHKFNDRYNQQAITSKKEQIGIAQNLQVQPKHASLNLFQANNQTPINIFAQNFKAFPTKQSTQTKMQVLASNTNQSLQQNSFKGIIPNQAVIGKDNMNMQPQRNIGLKRNQTPQKKDFQPKINKLLEDTPFPETGNLAANSLKQPAASSNTSIFSAPQPMINIFKKKQPIQNHEKQKKPEISSGNIFKNQNPLTSTDIFGSKPANIFKKQAEPVVSTSNPKQQKSEKQKAPLDNSLTKDTIFGKSMQSSTFVSSNSIFGPKKAQNVKIIENPNNQNIIKQTKSFDSNIFKQNGKKASNIFKQPAKTPNIFNQKSSMTIFGQPDSGNSENNKPFQFMLTKKPIQTQPQQDVDASQSDESQQQIVDVDVSDPQKSHMHHQYDKSQILFKELVCKFKVEGKLYQNQYISIEKIPHKDQLYVFVKSKTFQIIYCGRIIAQSQAQPIKGVYYNIEVKCLLDSRPKTEATQKASFQSIKVQFNTEQAGQTFAKLINDCLKK